MTNRWERRGHDRKPNAVVRGIYWITDWIGDFGYIWAQLKQSTGYFALTAANIIILLCILITSAIHSLELLRYAGATGGLEVFLLIAWEAMFIMSSTLLDKAIRQNDKKLFVFLKETWSLCFAFLMGLAFVLASNIMGMASNEAGLLIGFFTPIILLTNKAMLMWLIQSKNKSVLPTEKTTVGEQEIEQVSTGAAAQKSSLGMKDTPEKMEASPTEKAVEKDDYENIGQILGLQRLEPIEVDQENDKKESENLSLKEQDFEENPQVKSDEKEPEKNTSATNTSLDDKPKKQVNESQQAWTRRERSILRAGEKFATQNNKSFPGRIVLARVAKCSHTEAQKVIAKRKAEMEKQEEEKQAS